MIAARPPTRCSDESGLVSLWGFLFVIVLMGFTGLAFDVWHIWEARRDLQSVADSAALAGAGAVDEAWFRGTNPSSVRLDPDLARAYANDAIDAQGDLPTLSTPPVVSANFNLIEVRLETEVDLTLMRLFTATNSIEVEGRARGVPFRSTPCGDPVCTSPTTTPSP